jgi:hypothetical protein
MGVVTPTDELIFFRGVGIPPTRSLFLTLPSGKLSHNYGKSPCLMDLVGKFTISMAIVNSYFDKTRG